MKLKWPLLIGAFLFTWLILINSAGSFPVEAAIQKIPDTANVILNTTPTTMADPGFDEEPFESDTYFSSYTYHSWDIPEEVTGDSTFWIEIDLTNQMLYAYRGNQLISGFLVSTGTKSHKTVTGTFKIYAKHPAITMIGPGYHLEDVPYSMFFYKGYAVHGTYWHDNFGQPMSHGCVNMLTSEAKWVYENAPVGTIVFVHY